MTREAVSLEEESLNTVFNFKIKKEKYEEVPKETENTFVKVKIGQSGDSTKDGIISKFSESDDETVDCSQHDIICVKNEIEPEEEFQQINSGSEGLSENYTSVNRSGVNLSDKTFSRLNNHKRHKNFHKEAKPYSNIVCDKELERNHCLRLNLRMLSAKKPYKCVGCSKQFVTNSNLKTHLKMHSGEKPYSCVVCCNGFRSSSQFKRHERTHTLVRNHIIVLCVKRNLQEIHAYKNI
ncbi:zinc finger protein 75A-like isoform X1 [Limulus polyphemus]|uniref:Zinc finger protein 75A-like isoform X1 n=1 Tax=Limulus polyphemus TaxID=6850 RepID=A0ABM1RWF1_LIMPO|nr:zinc finger protein 75A-like isoform X1 [Limulus polyphemus]